MSNSSTTTRGDPALNTSQENNPWYNESLDESLSAATRGLLETYSKIPPGEIEAHIYKIRSLDWSIFPYPCIGQFRFLSLFILTHPSYTRILTTLSSSPNTSFLDIGCCVRQDIRALVSAGVPSRQLYATDLRREFWDLGFEFFCDRNTLQSTFVPGDFFADAGERIKEGLEGRKFNVVNTCSFLHLFGWEKQRVACKIIASLLSERGVVIGRQFGGRVAVEKLNEARGDSVKVFRHDEGSFRDLWEDVGREMGMRFSVKVEMREIEGVDVVEEMGDWKALVFEVQRVGLR